MNIDGDVLEIELDISLEDVISLKEFVTNRLQYIESIVITGSKDQFVSSSLFALLFSIKKSKPTMKIPLIESSVETTEYGTLYWNVS
jgi:hypothetical protein